MYVGSGYGPALCEGALGIFQPYTYKQRSILILLPLMMLAICTWALSPATSPGLDASQREVLLLTARIFFPGLFVIAVAMVVPAFDRVFQLATVTTVYVLSLMLLPAHLPEILDSPIVCVLMAVSSLLALFPYDSMEEDGFSNHTRRMIVTLFFVAGLPLSTMISVSFIVRQIDVFVLYTMEGTFGDGLLSVIYVPLYILLQSLGMHDMLGNLVSVSYHSRMVTSFVNTVIVCNIFALPATIFFRSLFTRSHVKLFLTLLVVICIMTSSIGTCVSLTLLLLLIFFPGAFGALLITGMCCFLLSYYMQIPAITTVENLYLPDLNYNEARSFFSMDNSNFGVLVGFAVLLPCVIIELSMVLKRDSILDRRRKLRNIATGYALNANSSPELVLLAWLRALGGISNISDVEEDGSWLYIQVVNMDLVSQTTLNSLVPNKMLIDSVNKLYLCDVGDQSRFLHQRLSKFIENNYAQGENEVPLSTPFKIEPMPYIHDNGS